MYQAMDSYLNVDTWHTAHPLDDQRFYEALAKIVRNPAFSAEAMGDYMRDREGIDPNNPSHSELNSVIDRRVTEAWAISEFLKLGL